MCRGGLWAGNDGRELGGGGFVETEGAREGGEG